MTGHRAILDRLDALHDQWAEFIDSGASILRWCVRADELRMVDAFVRLEAHEDGGRLPGLFVHIVEPCDGLDYGEVLAREIVSQWTAAEDDGEIEADLWEPVACDAADETLDLVAFLDGLGASLAELADYVVLVLTPEVITDGDAWMIFLGRLALQLGPAVKILILDNADAPALGPLAEAIGDKMLTRAANLDMPSAYRSLARGAAIRDHPGAHFRIAFTNLCCAAQSRDLAAVEEHTISALAAAKPLDAPELVVAVELARGHALLRSNEIDRALEAFDGARVGAACSAPELAPRLELICILARGAGLVHAGEFERAAQAYREAAALASADDLPARVDAWRMASYCHERAGHDDLAWAAGQMGLTSADDLDPELRRHSTLPFLGAALISLAERTHPNEVVKLEVRMVGLMGTRAWRPS